MLIYEIYVFMWMTIILFICIFYKFLNVLLLPFIFIINFLKKEYYRYFSLNTLKKEVLDKENIEQNMQKDSYIDKQIYTKKEEKQKYRVNKLFLAVRIAKERWDLDTYEKKLIELLSYDEENIKALEMLSSLYINLWKNKKSFSLLKKLIQIDMQNDNAIWNLSKIYIDMWEVDTAKVLIEKAIDINPNNHRYYVTNADILYNKWELEKALESMYKVLDMKPNNIIYLDAIASLYEELWEFLKAKAFWIKIIDLEPEYDRAKEKIQSF